MIEFTSQVDEVKHYQQRPWVKPPGGYDTFASLNKPEAYEDELEFIPQDKSETLDYKIAHEELSNPKES